MADAAMTTPRAMEPPALLKPVTKGERIAYIDTLRGFALLGILLPNILTFAWPIDMQSQTPFMPDTVQNELAIKINEVFFHGKFMFLFAMLFGVGVTVWDKKLAGQPLTRGTGRWYARCGWLAAFGMAHGWILWFGDILFMYALSGMVVVWWVRRLPAWVLVLGGLVVYLIGTGLMSGLTALQFMAPPEQMQAQQAQQMQFMGPEVQMEAYTGSYLDALRHRAIMLIIMYILAPLLLIWWATGLMMLGMGLSKAGFLLGRCSAKVYAATAILGAIIGFGLTLPVNAWTHNEDHPMRVVWWGVLYQLVGMPIGIAYASVLALVVKLAASNPVAAAISGGLANIGRMALSNYLSHSIICCAVFYGYGFGYYARVEFPQLWLVILAIWTFNFAFSAVWLRFFRFGPAEWLWRSLTYMTFQPIRRPKDDPAAAPSAPPVHSRA